LDSDSKTYKGLISEISTRFIGEVKKMHPDSRLTDPVKETNKKGGKDAFDLKKNKEN